MGWLRIRRERRREQAWAELVNGHEFFTTQDEPNKPVEITCWRCGYVHLDVDPFSPPGQWRPFSPVTTPCLPVLCPGTCTPDGPGPIPDGYRTCDFCPIPLNRGGTVMAEDMAAARSVIRRLLDGWEYLPAVDEWPATWTHHDYDKLDDEPATAAEIEVIRTATEDQ